MPTPKYLPELSSDQVIHTARCLLRGENPEPQDAAYHSMWVEETHFNGAGPGFGMRNLVAELLVPEEERLYSDRELRRDVLDTAIREVLQAVRDFKPTFSSSLVRLLLAAYRKELVWLVRQWEDAAELKPVKPLPVHEPQSVTAARHITKSQDPPRGCFLDSCSRHRWWGEREAVEDCLEERSSLIRLPQTKDYEHDEWIRETLERGDNPAVSRHAIDEALRELFQIYQSGALGTRNMNLLHRFQKALFDEMEALVKDWDALAGGEA